MPDPITTPGTPPVIGVIGGSGVYDIDGLENTHWEKVSSPFGDPSDELMMGELGGQKMVFLPRHGRGHRIPPSELNFRANIDCLKRAGVTEIISVSACGSFKEDLPPGTFVIADQFIDRTFAREKSFFGTGLVAHVGLGYPVCSRLGDAIEAAIKGGAHGAFLSGAGPSVLALATEREVTISYEMSETARILGVDGNPMILAIAHEGASVMSSS